MPLHSLTSCRREGGHAAHVARWHREPGQPDAAQGPSEPEHHCPGAARGCGVGPSTAHPHPQPAGHVDRVVPPGPCLQGSRSEQDRDALSRGPGAGVGTWCQPRVSRTGQWGAQGRCPTCLPYLSPEPSAQSLGGSALPAAVPCPKDKAVGNSPGPPPLAGRPRGRHCTWAPWHQGQAQQAQLGQVGHAATSRTGHIGCKPHAHAHALTHATPRVHTRGGRCGGRQQPRTECAPAPLTLSSLASISTTSVSTSSTVALQWGRGGRRSACSQRAGTAV